MGEPGARNSTSPPDAEAVTESRASEWYRALTVEERAAILRTCAPPGERVPRDEDTARRHLDAWRSQAPFQDEVLFERRLAMDGLTLEGFEDVLGAPAEVLAQRAPQPPYWLEQLLRAYREHRDSRPIAPEVLAETPEMGFLYLVEPLIRLYRERFLTGARRLLERHRDAPFDPPRVVPMVSQALMLRMLKMISATLVLELNAARVQGSLEGPTPEARFASFLERLREPEVSLAILSEYPVLARMLVQYFEDWCATSLELLDRLGADWHDLRAALCPDRDPGLLSDLHFGAGDRHRGGRSVVLATFESGLVLVYKPKSLAVDRHFQETLAWMNSKGAEPAFRTLRILDRGEHGWVEHVTRSDCGDASEVERFYRRLGGYLAILYVLEATDLHYENLIAAGEHPVLIDLESFFNPRITEAVDPRRGIDPAAREMHESVLRTGLLPARILFDRNDPGFDVGGMVSVAGEHSPAPSAHLIGGGTDTMRVVAKKAPLQEAKNRPRLDGQAVDLLAYVDAIIAGFTATYELLMRHRDELTRDGGVLSWFADDEVRVLMRMTVAYLHLLAQGYHPDKLRDGLDQDRHWDALWLGAAVEPLMAELIAAERASGRRSDVAMFTTTPGSRAVFWERGQGIEDFFEMSGLERVRQRIDRLSAEDCRKQVWFIRAALATAKSDEPKPSRHAVRDTGADASPDQLLAAAKSVGDRLEATAFRGTDGAGWIGLCLRGDGSFNLLPLGIDLYSGLPGQALFLAYLGEVDRTARYSDLAREAVVALRRQLRGAQVKEIGAFTGLGGIIYVLAHLGVLLRDRDLLAAAEDLVEQLRPLVARDERFDIIGGSAGCLAALLSLHHANPTGAALPVAMECGERLLAGGRPMAEGVGWPSEGGTSLAGFAHGAAGIATALVELAAVTKDLRFRDAARQAIAYERSLFRAEVGNWLDLRSIGSPEKRPMTAWCNGATGIGLSRIRMMQLLDDPGVRVEAEVALATTVAEGLGQGHSLCHGDSGSLELLLQAELHDVPVRRGAGVRRVAAGVLASIAAQGWICGVPTGVETPGLMTGITGIGYECLRLAAPGRVPSVLLLERPPEPGA